MGGRRQNKKNAKKAKKIADERKNIDSKQSKDKSERIEVTEENQKKLIKAESYTIKRIKPKEGEYRKPDAVIDFEVLEFD